MYKKTFFVFLRTASALFFCGLILAGGSGCASVDAKGRLPHKKMDLSISGLDWVEFRYTPHPADPAIRHLVRLELFGSGAVLLRTGPSPQVENDFAHNVSDPRWNSMVQQRLNLSPAEMEQVLQVFINSGLIPARRRKPPETVRGPFLSYAGTIGTEKFICTTDNAYLCDVVKDFLETNFSATLQQAAKIPR